MLQKSTKQKRMTKQKMKLLHHRRDHLLRPFETVEVVQPDVPRWRILSVVPPSYGPRGYLVTKFKFYLALERNGLMNNDL